MPTNKIRVLIVDDHDLLRSGLVVFFETTDDLELVGEGRNGMEAVHLCGSLHPDVVLMDLVMPEGDGVSAIRLIRQQYPHIRIIALTSFGTGEMVQAALQAGAISYLLKNVSTDKLAKAIRAAYAGESVLSQEATQALVNAAHRPPSVTYELTLREIEVLRAMVKGQTNVEIADNLSISISTVKKHVHNILDKLGTTNRTEAVALALEHKLVDKGREPV